MGVNSVRRKDRKQYEYVTLHIYLSLGLQYLNSKTGNITENILNQQFLKSLLFS